MKIYLQGFIMKIYLQGFRMDIYLQGINRYATTDWDIFLPN